MLKIVSYNQTEQITKLLRASDLEFIVFNEDEQEIIQAKVTKKEIFANIITFKLDYKDPLKISQGKNWHTLRVRVVQDVQSRKHG